MAPSTVLAGEMGERGRRPKRLPKAHDPMSLPTIIRQAEKVIARPLLQRSAVAGASPGADRLRSASQWLGRKPR